MCRRLQMPPALPNLAEKHATKASSGNSMRQLSKEAAQWREGCKEAVLGNREMEKKSLTSR